jgi:hypothetical protein
MRRALLLASFLRVSSAILVANGSPCGTNCGNVLTATAPDQIVCDDGEYTSKTEGRVFQSCVSCEAMSSYTTNPGTGPTSDLQAMLCKFPVHADFVHIAGANCANLSLQLICVLPQPNVCSVFKQAFVVHRKFIVKSYPESDGLILIFPRRACGLIQGALEYGNLSSTVTPYGYCSLWSNFDLDKCTDCLSVSGQNVLRNCMSDN